LNFTPKSGFCELRYRVYQLRSTFSLMRFVGRPIFFAPVAWLLGKVRKASKSTGSSPLESSRHSERQRDSVRHQYCRQCTGACPHQDCSALQYRLDSLPGPRPTRCIVATGLLRSTRLLPQIARVRRPLSETSQCCGAPPAHGSRYPTTTLADTAAPAIPLVLRKERRLTAPCQCVERLHCLRKDLFQ